MMCVQCPGQESNLDLLNLSSGVQRLREPPPVGALSSELPGLGYCAQSAISASSTHIGP